MEDWEQMVYNFAKGAHDGQLDDCGKDYFEAHILGVVSLVKQVTDDPRIITTAYLHDTVEDTDITYQNLCSLFDDPVPDWVMELTHEGEKDQFGHYFPRLKSKECVLIKFADRLSNLSRMEAWSEKRQMHYVSKSVFWKTGDGRMDNMTGGVIFLPYSVYSTPGHRQVLEWFKKNKFPFVKMYPDEHAVKFPDSINDSQEDEE